MKDEVEVEVEAANNIQAVQARLALKFSRLESPTVLRQPHPHQTSMNS
jgi:hypothetical protein